MAVDPLRALFLDVGVQDAPSVAALARINAAANATEAAFLRVATAAKAAGSLTPVISANTRLAASYTALATSATRASAAMRQVGADPLGQYWNLPGTRGFGPGGPVTGAVQALRGNNAANILTRPGAAAIAGLPFDVRSGGVSNAAAIAQAIRVGQANAPFTSPLRSMQARTGRGNFGLGTSIFLATAGAGAANYGFQQAAGLQRGSLVASFANGQSPAANQNQILGMSGQYNMRLADATSLIRDVSQLGISNPQQQMEVARAGAMFNVVQPDVAANEASTTVYRLLLASSKNQDDLNKSLSQASRYASGIYEAANVSAANNKEVFAMVTELAPLSQVMNLSAQGNIALAAAFSNLNGNQRELFRGALTRMTIQGKLNPNDPVGSLLGIANRLKAAGSDSERMDILKSLGFKNVRDVQTVSVLAASMDTFAKAYEAVGSELNGTNTLGTKVNDVLHTMSGEWDGLKSSMDRAAVGIVGSLAPALHLVLGLVTGLTDAIASNPALELLAGVAAGGLAYKGVRALYGRYMGGMPAAAMLAEMTPFERRTYGRTSRALTSVLPVGVSKRLAFTSFGANLAEGAYLGSLAGTGRMSSLSLGLMRSLPVFGESLATRAAGTMAAGGLAGGALELATGPVGWIIGALTLGAPLFEKIGNALHGMASKGGALGAVLNTVSLIFSVMAAGGRLLNTAFSWLGTAGKFLLNMVTFGHADDILGGVNYGLSAAQDWFNKVDNTTQPAPGGATPNSRANVNVTINTGGSPSGYQQAMDEVSRRAARTVTSNSYPAVQV